MPHSLSLQCYLGARERPEIHPRQYEDLEAILRLFELIDTPPRFPGSPEPAQFRTPKLMIVDDDANISDMLQGGLVTTGYPEEAIQVFSSAEDAIGYAKRSAVDIARLISVWSAQCQCKESICRACRCSRPSRVLRPWQR